MKILKVILITALFLLIPFHTAYASWAYPFVIYNNNVYITTDQKVDSELIGSKLGQVTKYSDHETSTQSGNFSNAYPKGTNYYEIKGTNIKDAIAIQEKDGTYIEANFEYEREDNFSAKYDIKPLIIFPAALVLIIFIIWRLVRRKDNNS